jgi:hypothetical protein
MELTEGSETSANHNLTPWKYPKEYIQYSKHGESLKSRRIFFAILTTVLSILITSTWISLSKNRDFDFQQVRHFMYLSFMSCVTQV